MESVGKDVSKFRKRDQVFGNSKLRLGAYGEYVCLPATYTLAPKPYNLSFEEAAAVPLGGLNALHFLRKANIQNGEKVLVNGAGGSIGTFGVQIAKAMGAEVTAVDSTIKEKMLRRIGADHFIDYTADDHRTDLKQLQADGVTAGPVPDRCRQRAVSNPLKQGIGQGRQQTRSWLGSQFMQLVRSAYK